MKKALSIAILSLFVLALGACNDTNDITGINAGKRATTSALTPTLTVLEVGPEAVTTVISLANRPHQIPVMAPNQPAPTPHKRGATPTPTPTPTPMSFH